MPTRSQSSLISIAAIVVGFALCAGCGGSPLIGTWRYTGTELVPPVLRMAGLASPSPEVPAPSVWDLTLSGDMTASAVVTLHMASTASVLPRCRATWRISGMTWFSSTTGTTTHLTLGGMPTGYVERTLCAQPNENQAPTPDNDPNGVVRSFLGEGDVVLNGNTLTYTPTQPARGALSFARQ